MEDFGLIFSTKVNKETGKKKWRCLGSHIMMGNILDGTNNCDVDERRKLIKETENGWMGKVIKYIFHYVLLYRYSW